MIGTMAYRADYENTIGEEKALRRTAAEKNCNLPPPAPTLAPPPATSTPPDASAGYVSPSKATKVSTEKLRAEKLAARGASPPIHFQKNLDVSHSLARKETAVQGLLFCSTHISGWTWRLTDQQKMQPHWTDK